MGNLIEHARKELELAGLFSKDSDYGGMLGEAVLKMVQVFADEGHSGYSARLAVQLFEKVAMFQPLTPLTGADDEWYKPMDDLDMYQNVRCSTVFKDGKDGQAYDINGRVFREPGGACYTSADSRVAVQFPYVPATEYVDVPATPHPPTPETP